MSILLPAMGRARRAARAIADMSALQQIMTGYAIYADDHKGMVLPGYIPASWVSRMEVLDEVGERLSGPMAQRYPWRLAPYLDYNFAAMYKDPRLLERYQQRSDFQYVVSVSPSFGLNAEFVGGRASPSGFGFNSAAIRAWGQFYITRMDQAHRPDNLVVFASAHGLDPDGGSPLPGYFEVTAPNLVQRQWTTSYNEDDPPAVHGHVDARYDGRAITGQLDGHAAMLRMSDLDDMRRWSNQAGAADWLLGTR